MFLRLSTALLVALSLVTCTEPGGDRLPSSTETPAAPAATERAPLAAAPERVTAVVAENPYFDLFPGDTPEFRFVLKKSLALECAPGEFEVFEYLAIKRPAALPAGLQPGQTVELEIPSGSLSCPDADAQGSENAQASEIRVRSRSP